MATPSHNRIEPGSVNIPVGQFPETSSSLSVDPNEIASHVIQQLNTSVAHKDYPAIASLFLEDGYWRDHLCMTWDFRTIHGREDIIDFVRGSQLTKVEIDRSPGFRAPHVGNVDAFGDVLGIEFFTNVTTEVGSGAGIMRLLERDGQWKIFILFTSLQGLKGHEEESNVRRPKGVEHGQRESQNWQDKRTADLDYENKEPAVVIIGVYTLLLLRIHVNESRCWPSWSNSGCPSQNAQRRYPHHRQRRPRRR